MSSTHVTRRFAASRADVFRAIVDPDAIVRWKFPQGMTCRIDRLDDALRVSLTYDVDRAGKTAERTDTYRSRFVDVVPEERVVEIDEFETSDPAFQGEMTITYTLADAPGGGTELRAAHENVPRGIAAADNELGWQEALARLADLVEVR